MSTGTPPKAPMGNIYKILFALVLAFIGGAAQAATDSKATVMDYVRHGLIECGPVAVALKLTLQ
jgi:hypothetical protein